MAIYCILQVVKLNFEAFGTENPKAILNLYYSFSRFNYNVWSINPFMPELNSQCPTKKTGT